MILLLGTKPLIGRAFSPEDDREGAPGTALLTYGLWQERFAGDPGVLGRTLLLDDEACRVIGVMPAGFLFPRRETRVLLPLRPAGRKPGPMGMNGRSRERTVPGRNGRQACGTGA